MGTIEDIIKAIDNELIETGKVCLTLGQANQLLVDQDLITISEKSDKSLKKLLEENKIPHAYQTESTPKQWRIPLSKEGKLRNKTVKQKTTKQKLTERPYESYQNQYNKSNYTICPGCGLSLFIPNEIINGDYLKCQSCGTNFLNPLKSKQITNNSGLTKTQRNWLIAIVVIIILLVIGTILNNGKIDTDKPANYSDDATRKELYQNTPPENGKSLNVNKFSGQKFTFKSTLNDNEFDGEIIQTNHETTYHTFDFTNLTVTQKSPLNGQWVTITYPMNSFYEEKGVAATTYVIRVNQLGVKEIWFSPDVPNLGYDYEDGTRIACYNVTKMR